MIGIVRLTGAEKALVADLKPAGGQERFVRDGAFAAGETDPGLDLYAVSQGGAVVGMFKLDRAYAAAPRHDFCRPGDLGLRGVLVDAAHQGKGIGRQMLAALPELVRAGYPGVRRLVLTVNCENPAARAAYLASEALAETWRLTDRRLLGPGGRAIPLAQVQSARAFLGSVQVTTTSGDRHLIKYQADPAATANRIALRR